MSEYGNYDWNQQNENQEPLQVPEQSPKMKPKKKGNKSSMARRLGAVALSAVLFGGVAGGVFTGVVYTSGAARNISKVESTENQTADQKKSSSTLQTVAASADGTTDSQSLDVADIAEGAMPSIVAITNQSVQEVQSYFSMFGGTSGMQQEVESQGSGIVIGQNDEELLIVTNNHVVESADTLSACFIDNEAYEAYVKGTDEDNDLAVIAVKLSDISEDTMSKIKVAQLGNSDDLKVGQQVVAIGNALGYGQSVTTGIVSAVDRQVGNSTSENGYIQTDAAINPGNSGGALLNMQGQVVGINSAKLASTEVEGMGYAIPVSTASPIIENLMNRETREKVSEDQASALGISGQTVDSSIASTYGIPEGVYVGEVNEGGAAEKAGISAGSVITAFDGTRVKSIESLKDLLTYYAAGETVEVTIKVADNGEYKEKQVKVTLDHAQSTENAQKGSGTNGNNNGNGLILR